MDTAAGGVPAQIDFSSVTDEELLELVRSRGLAVSGPN